MSTADEGSNPAGVGILPVVAEPERVLAHNRAAWDERARSGAVFTRPATAEELAAPLAQLDPRGWYGDVTAKRVLCLGAGGGRHGPLLARAGAFVTVVDLSPAMLAIDRRVAREQGLTLFTVEASIDDLTPLPNASFDLVIQPVSSCYVPSVVQVYKEVARVLDVGGIYVSQHKNPTNLQCNVQPFTSGAPYALQVPYTWQGPLPPALPSRYREAGTVEFLHRWEDLVGGLCRSGFILEDLVEVGRQDVNAEPGTFEHRNAFVRPYVRLRARRGAA